VGELDFLREATGEEAVAFFDDVDPEELVHLIAAHDDDQLLELLGRNEVRTAAVGGVLARLDEFAIAERLAAVRGLVRFDLQRGGTLLEQHALQFGGGTTRLLRDPVAAAPDVVLTTSLLRFVRLVSGERNAGLEYLAGKLDITGDAMLALAVGGIFRVPGSGAVAVDPALLDPVEVATVLRDVSTEHLRKVMSGGFRGVVLDEIFRRLPEFLHPERAARARLNVALRLTGNPTGEVERYVVDVRDGEATVTPGDGGGGQGESGAARDATVTMEAHDFVRLATGHLNPVTGVLRGKLRVRGDRTKALELSSLIEIPSASTSD
jgi:putative sterol carrier protein